MVFFFFTVTICTKQDAPSCRVINLELCCVEPNHNQNLKLFLGLYHRSVTIVILMVFEILCHVVQEKKLIHITPILNSNYSIHTGKTVTEYQNCQSHLYKLSYLSYLFDYKTEHHLVTFRARSQLFHVLPNAAISWFTV